MKRLLTLTESPDFVCYRYRVKAFRQTLADRGWELDLLPRAATAGDFMRQLPAIAAADVVILQRRLLSWWKRHLLRSAAKVLVYDVDDAVFCRDSNSAKTADNEARWRRFRRTVHMADLCTAGSHHLWQHAARCTDPAKVELMPTCVNHHQYPLAPHNRTSGEVQMVWVGSHGTLQSLYDSTPMLTAAAQGVPRLSLKVICDVFPQIPGVRVIPTRWASSTEATEIAGADIGISWLPDHPWSLGKCGLKVLQYMAAGLPVIANPIGVHHDMIIHGVTGFLAATPEQWSHAAQTLAASPQLRRKMGQAARARVIDRYSVKLWGPRLAGMLDKLVARGDAHDLRTDGAMAA